MSASGKLLTMMLISLVAFGQNLIVNGGFEDYSDLYCNTTNCFMGLPANTLSPWVVTSTPFRIELVRRALWPAWGNWTIDLNVGTPQTIAQTVTLIPQNLYVLRFSLNQNANPGGGVLPTKTGFVSVTGLTDQYFRHVWVYQVNGNNATDWVGSYFATQWKNFTYMFRATTANTTITIGSLTPGTNGPVIDEVTLTPFSQSCIGR